jgi:hypothetical protein
VPVVCEVQLVAGAPSTRIEPSLLIELPHGATRRKHFDAVRRRLSGSLPADLEEFFYVNTDVGAPECAAQIASLLLDPLGSSALRGLLEPELRAAVARTPKRGVLIVRSLVPRTFIDCNRTLDDLTDDGRAAGMTAAVPAYVRRPEDVETLLALWRSYQEVANRAYAQVCGTGGVALILHTYAPRAVDIEQVDEQIVPALRRAYEPEVYAGWPVRPEVDVISENPEGRVLAPPGAVEALRRYYGRIGIPVAENVSYRLHPASMGHRHAVRYPGQVLCLELSRACLAEPFTPFEEMHVSEKKAARMALPIAAALLSELARRG